MKRVKQRRLTDCFSACLASLLSVPLETVPHFYSKAKTVEAFYSQAQRWLAKHHGLTLVTILRPDGVRLNDLICRWQLPANFIASVPVPGDFHAVVARIYRSRLRVVHDPGNWARTDLRHLNDFSFLVPLFTKGSPTPCPQSLNTTTRSRRAGSTSKPRR